MNKYRRIGSAWHSNNQRNCSHPDKSVQVEREGGIRFYGGDIYESTREKLVCIECGAELELIPEKRALELIPF